MEHSQLIRAGGMKELETPHFASSNEIMELGNHWLNTKTLA